MPSERSIDALLLEMREALTFIESHSHGLSAEDFASNWLVRDAVSMRLVVLGEAAARLPDSFRRAHPDIRWRSIIGLRHLLAHDYGAADPEVLWKIAVEQIGELAAKLAAIRDGGD